MKFIKLTKGYYTKVDNNDYKFLSQYKWLALSCGSGGPYAARKVVVNGKDKVVMMHRVIMMILDGDYVDHKNRDPLDNRKENLRVCNASQNAFNSRKQNGNYSSKYVGVSYVTNEKVKYKKWTSYFKKEGKNIYLGHFKTEKEAALAYNKAAKNNIGRFACLNQVC